MARAMSAEMVEAMQVVRRVLDTGPVHDPIDGRVTSIIADAAGLSVDLVSRSVALLDYRGLIHREVNDRRTTCVRLLTDAERAERTVAIAAARAKAKSVTKAAPKLPRETATAPVQASEPTPLLTLVSHVIDAYSDTHAEHAEPAPSGPAVNHAELAAHLLRLVVDAAAGPGRESANLREANARAVAGMHAVEVRLGEQTEVAQRLRAKNDLMSDELRAARVEIDGLRSRAQQAERNLSRVLAGGMLDVQRERELREIMSAMRAPMMNGRGQRGDHPSVIGGHR